MKTQLASSSQIDYSQIEIVDVHAHVHTGDRKTQAQDRNEDAKRLFGTPKEAPKEISDVYKDLNGIAVIFDVDAETTTGLKISNDEVAILANQSQGRLIGFGSVDPRKGDAALTEIERCKSLGMTGMKFQPITQRFSPGKKRYYPLWELCESLGLIVIFHTGITAIGNGSPGGRGLQLKYGRPFPAMDDIAAEFRDLTIIAAHPGWPWHEELVAVARHKGNVYIDLSGWSPKYFPETTIRYMNSVIPEKFLFGSDFPLFPPRRWLDEFGQLNLKDEVRSKVLRDNALRILGLAK
ncbi:MAG: amidohydrolase [Acidimicrobiaceae bacterium]|nr:amidohydrolase [Acidimicrobiaceae bacterium]